MTRSNANLFSALTAAFPTRRSACAVETDSGLLYSWRDLLDASAMLANLLDALQLPAASRIPNKELLERRLFGAV